MRAFLIAATCLLWTTSALASSGVCVLPNNGCGGSSAGACQGLDDGATCSSGGITYTTMMGVPIPQPSGTEADLRGSKYLASDGEQYTATSTLDIANQWSISAWVRMDDTLASGQSRGIVSLIAGGAVSRADIYFTQLNLGGTFGNVNVIRSQLYDTSGTEFKDIRYVTPFKAGEWHHLVFTFDGDAAGDPYRIYVDGVYFNPDVVDGDHSDHKDNTGTMDNTARQVIVGDYQSGGSGEDISFHQVAMWDEVVTPRQVADMFHGSWGVDGGDFGAVHAWRFCQNGQSATADVEDIVGSVDFIAAVGTETCLAAAAPLPPAAPNVALTSGEIVSHPQNGLVKGRGWVVGFGDSQVGDSPANQSGDPVNWPEWRSPLMYLSGGWVWQSQAEGGTYCGNTDLPSGEQSVQDNLTTWISGGANDALGWVRSKTYVLIRCGANDGKDTAAGDDPVSAASSWANMKAMADAVTAAGMNPILVTPIPLRHTNAGCPDPSVCTSTALGTDTQAENVDDFVQYIREKALEEGYALCDTYSVFMRLDNTEDRYPPVSETRWADFMVDYIHHGNPDGLKYDGDFITRYCLPDIPAF